MQVKNKEVYVSCERTITERYAELKNWSLRVKNRRSGNPKEGGGGASLM
jgi:hypothetical protein